MQFNITNGPPSTWAAYGVDEVLANAREYRSAAQTLQDGPSSPLTSASGTVRALLSNPRLVFRPVQRADLSRGGIDQRLLDTLATIAHRHTIVITALRADHAPGTNHEAGRAIDIGSVDGEICQGTRTGRCAQLVRELARVTGPLRSTELIYCFDPDGPSDPRGFAKADHCDHIHVGWDA